MQEVDHRYLNVLALAVLCRLAAVGVAPAGQGENNDVLCSPLTRIAHISVYVMHRLKSFYLLFTFLSINYMQRFVPDSLTLQPLEF